RNALMRQLSSLEPALSPEDISKQRLQLEDAIREIENQYVLAPVPEADPLDDLLVSEPEQSEAPVTSQEPEPEPEPTPEPEPEPETVYEAEPEPEPEPVAEPEPLPEVPAEPEPYPEEAQAFTSPEETAEDIPAQNIPEEPLDQPLAEEQASEAIPDLPDPEVIDEDTEPQPTPENFEDHPVVSSAEPEISVAPEPQTEPEPADFREPVEDVEPEPANTQPSMPRVAGIDTDVGADEPVFPEAEPSPSGSAPEVSLSARSPLTQPEERTTVEIDPQNAPIQGASAGTDPALAATASAYAESRLSEPHPDEDPLTELQRTMAQDGVQPINFPGSAQAGGAGDARASGALAGSADPLTGYEGVTPGSVEAVASQNAIAQASKKGGIGRALVLVLILLIIVGTGAFAWSQRDNLGPVVAGLTGLFGSDEAGDTQQPTTDPAERAASNAPQKDEDRLLPGEPDDINDNSAGSDGEEQSIRLGERIELPQSVPQTVPKVTAPPVTVETPADDQPAVSVVPSEDRSDVTAVPPAVTTPPAEEAPIFTPPSAESNAETDVAAVPDTPAPAAGNLFGATAILYEEQSSGAGQTDVSNGTVVWETIPNGSETIGATNQPSVRGNATIQNRDLRVRFEILRNLDESLPASHLIELEFIPGPLFDGDNVSNIRAVVLKPQEQQKGRQLQGAIAKVSDTVFWLAMSNSAADQASNTDALKTESWIDIPIVFESGKRAILTLEKGAAGRLAIDKAFETWEAS
ncbi:MAG: hypothetical protein AAGE89_17310, partial [Pseudomonadota bacterium]